MKTILFILEYFKPHVGGSEILFDNLIQGLVKQDYRIIVLTSRYSSALPIYEKLPYGNHSVEIYRTWSNRYNFMRYGYRKGLDLLRKYSIDLVQTSTFTAMIPAGILRMVKKVKTIAHVHEIYVNLRYKFFGWKWFFYKAFEWLIFQFTFDYYTCSSEYTRESIQTRFNIPVTKLTTTYCGIDYELWDPNSVDTHSVEMLRKNYNLQDKYVGLYFGRPGVAKGLFDYLKAIPIIKQLIPNFTAFLIVPTSEKSSVGVIKSTLSNDEVTQLIQELQIEKEVIWIDKVNYSELRNYITMADVTVLPTRAEWFGLAIAEVCALDKPLVTTHVGSVPEVAGGQVVFVQPGDLVDIARGVCEVYRWNVPVVPQKRFYWKECVERFTEVYKMF